MVDKTEGAIKNVQSWDTGNIGRTRYMTNTSKTTNNNKTHATWKTWEMNNIDPITYRWWAQVLRKAKPFLYLIRHPTCYSYGKYMFDTNIPVPSCTFSYDSWIYNYLCTPCLTLLMVWVRISIRARCTTLCDKVCLWFGAGRQKCMNHNCDG